MLYWVVREVPHWFTPCVQLFFKNSFCMSSFCVVVYCRPLLPRQFFILHKTPLQKQSLHGGSCCQGKLTWKCPWTCCRIPSMILKALLSSTGAQTLVSTSVFSKYVFHSLSNCWCHSSLRILHSVLLSNDILKSFWSSQVISGFF